MEKFGRWLSAVGLSVGIAGMAFPRPGWATIVNFNEPNMLTSQFSQEPSPGAFYTQSQTGGVSGGAVNGYSGSDYSATAVLKNRTLGFGAGKSISLGIDFYFNGKLTPLAPGVNAVRSLRLGLLGSQSSAFEIYGDQAAYIEGLYSLTQDQMVIAAVDQTRSASIGGMMASFVPVAGSWYELSATFQNPGNGMKTFGGTVLSLGLNGRSPPVPLASWKQTLGIASPSGLAGSVYAGFSALAGGGISRVDNLSVPGRAQELPEPSSLGLMAIALCLLGTLMSATRRTHSWKDHLCPATP